MEAGEFKGEIENVNKRVNRIKGTGIGRDPGTTY